MQRKIVSSASMRQSTISVSRTNVISHFASKTIVTEGFIKQYGQAAESVRSQGGAQSSASCRHSARALSDSRRASRDSYGSIMSETELSLIARSICTTACPLRPPRSHFCSGNMSNAAELTDSATDASERGLTSAPLVTSRRLPRSIPGWIFLVGELSQLPGCRGGAGRTSRPTSGAHSSSLCARSGAGLRSRDFIFSFNLVNLSTELTFLRI